MRKLWEKGEEKAVGQRREDDCEREEMRRLWERGGIEMQMELFRCGQKVAVITHETNYSYDNPKLYKHDPSIDLLPGDVIKTTCVYSSEGHTRPVSFGIATSDEMCYGFLFAYPSEAIPDPCE
ncbi:dopamine beta hydroxylase-like protein [Plakobranchus ocellatus]|uniref:Dopamine beta hydroxylase-like protein n=1 Tax=Plakobranchus ocellatus TaxID=259542 RepID=A0AAV3Y8V6_9GAST|nr:dopamine beta hydroxylase-like protein [Plakobranchus ocellatus]